MKQAKVAKISKKTEDTRRIAKIFLNILLKDKREKGALVVGLSGDLGAGKTTFIQAIARQLGIKSKIASPTFVIIKNYELRITNYRKLFHVDAYRLKNEKELLHLGWEEIIMNKEHLVFIEWPENVKKAMPKTAKFIRIFHTKKENERVLYLHRCLEVPKS